MVETSSSKTPTQGCEVVIDAVSKTFGNHAVLKDISLTIRPGEFFTLLGPSGCGKTTLLRAIAGFHPIDGGKILFNGRNVTSLAAWDRNIGFVFQNYALWPNQTVFDNVAYGLKLRKVPKNEVAERVRAALAQVELHGVEKRYPAEMSGGMQQRIALARALVINPPLLLMDEPMSNLDARLRVALRHELRSLQKRLGLTAIYVTHDQEEALEMSDRIAVMQNGIVQQLADPETIYSRPANRFVAEFVGSANFLEGEFDEAGFQMADGSRLPIIGSGHRGKGTLVVRPEQVMTRENGSALVNATVKDRRFMGKAWTQSLRLENGATISVETRHALDLDSRVGVDFETITFLPSGV
ncbi:ABC transporter ATP-binding protein (plasmid) [Agrobacterium tumefaciens]|uniref:ABC transporter ATP-binding protein n=1 Tax=Agrobacterium tumefaciens TaxID=358 RepID=UPI001574B053|nr:ABC transporter ATP-binding protein [Agrobacterium tumefaciens]NSZ87194.1 ABC transporter ATP-binding protein [Agrobacterium tumefaciens]WCA72399.1 ABC transporter ATP-binding protein [Agrobacterium tumefaciens]